MIRAHDEMLRPLFLPKALSGFAFASGNEAVHESESKCKSEMHAREVSVRGRRVTVWTLYVSSVRVRVLDAALRNLVLGLGVVVLVESRVGGNGAAVCALVRGYSMASGERKRKNKKCEKVVRRRRTTCPRLAPKIPKVQMRRSTRRSATRTRSPARRFCWRRATAPATAATSAR